jgi:hypothetical protein
MFLATFSALSLAAVALANGNSTFSFQVVNANSGSAGDLFGKKVIAARGHLYVNYPNNAVQFSSLLAARLTYTICIS